MKRILSILMIVLAVFSLVACSAKEVELVGNYVNGRAKEFVYDGNPVGTTYISTDVKVFSDNTYELVTTETTDMFGMVGGTTVITSYGTYTKAEGSDGFVALTLSPANRVVYASYSTMGGFAFNFDTNVDEEFIIPGGDDVAMGKDEFISGLELNDEEVVYIVLDSSNNETSHLEFSK